MRSSRKVEQVAKILAAVADNEPSEKPPEVDPEQRKIEEGLARFGGASTLKVYRLDVAGTEAWCGSLPVTDGLLENLEETITERWGGGDFKVLGMVKGKQVYYCRVAVDKRVHPVKVTEDEQRKLALQQGQVYQPPVPLTEARVLELFERFASRLQPQQPAISIKDVLELQGKHMDQMIAMMKREPVQAAPAGSFADEVKKLLAVKEAATGLFGSDGGGEGGDVTPKRALGYAALEKALDKVADKAGDKIGDALGGRVADEISGEKGGAKATTEPAGKKQGEQGGEKVEKGGGVVLSKEECDALLKRRKSAPTVREAFPDAAKEQEQKAG